MKIIIDISDYLFEVIKKSGSGAPKVIDDAIVNGIPLPKNHGRLIDADELEECKEIMNTITGECKYAVRMDDIRNTQTIIGESEDKEE